MLRKTLRKKRKNMKSKFMGYDLVVYNDYCENSDDHFLPELQTSNDIYFMKTLWKTCHNLRNVKRYGADFYTTI